MRGFIESEEIALIRDWVLAFVKDQPSLGS